MNFCIRTPNGIPTFGDELLVTWTFGDAKDLVTWAFSDGKDLVTLTVADSITLVTRTPGDENRIDIVKVLNDIHNVINPHVCRSQILLSVLPP